MLGKDAATPRAFRESISGPDDEIDLAEAALTVARIEYPELDVRGILEGLNALAARVVARVDARAGSASDGLDRIEALSSVVVGDMGLHGAAQNYYDPRNSFLNDVIERREGIPVSLGILYMSIGARAGIALGGTGVPMHFIVRAIEPNPPLFIDVYSGARVVTQEKCREVLDRALRLRGGFQPEMLETIPNRSVITRLLTNLKMIYLNALKYDKAVDILDLLVIANPDVPPLLRERGLARYRLGEGPLAREDLEAYLDQEEEPDDAAEIRGYLRRISP